MSQHPESIGAKEGDLIRNPGINYKSFSLHDTNEITLAGYGGKVGNPRGFIVDISGTLTLVSPFDEEVPIPVISGVLYPLRFKIAKDTGTSGPTKVIAVA